MVPLAYRKVGIAVPALDADASGGMEATVEVDITPRTPWTKDNVPWTHIAMIPLLDVDKPRGRRRNLTLVKVNVITTRPVLPLLQYRPTILRMNLLHVALASLPLPLPTTVKNRALVSTRRPTTPLAPRAHIRPLARVYRHTA